MIKSDFFKYSFIGLLTMAVSAPAAGQRGFTMTGSVDAMPDSIKVVLSDVEDPNGDVVKLAEAFSSAGKFSLKGSVKTPKMCRLSFRRKNAQGDYHNVFSVPLMAENTALTLSSPVGFDSLLKVTLPERIMDISGGKIQTEFKDYVKASADAQLKAKKMSSLEAKKYFDTNADEDTVAKYSRLTDDAEARFAAVRDRFIKEHPAYNISAYLTQKELEKQFVYTADEINAMADLVKACPDTARTSTIERRRAFALKYALKAPCPAFEVTRPDGTAVAFTSLTTPGKYTFIDFWASWCGPCRAAIPHVRELYKKYGDRLDVFSVSGDDNEKAWRKAMDEEKMEWSQFILKDEQMQKAADAFFLSTIPRLILLDPEGRVICSTNKPAAVTDCLEKHLGK